MPGEGNILLLLLIACLLLLCGLVLLVVIRRMIRPSSSKPSTPTPTSSPWKTSGERMPMPESDIKEEP